MADQEPPQSVQDVFLAQLVRTRSPVTVFLTNGVKLQGRVADFDRFSLMLTRAGHAQLVFKKSNQHRHAKQRDHADGSAHGASRVLPPRSGTPPGMIWEPGLPWGMSAQQGNG